METNPGEIKMVNSIKKVLIIIGLVSLSAVSCVVTPVAGRVRSHSEEVSLDGAESVQLRPAN